MGDELEELPLFPLNAVLFPYGKTQLHIFEDRYREMIRYCMQYDKDFGIVLIRSGKEVGGTAEPYMVGTAVRLESVQQFDDGRMDIKIRGERRFRIRKFDESRSFLVGYVEPLVELEVEETPELEELFMRAKDYVTSYIQSYFSRIDMKISTIKMPADPTALSFVIANFLQLENREKQRLLETTDTVERIEEIIPILEQHILEVKSPEVYKMDESHFAEWIHPN
jgi:Lon protease-like protein